MTRHCHRCGTEWPVKRQPGRSETCEKCRADLRVCLNCEFHDRAVAYQCRERRAEPVDDKALANFCEWFILADREYEPDPTPHGRADQARERFKKLFGD